MSNPTVALLSDIELFLEQTGTLPTNFGIAAMGDPTFVRRLRAGRELRYLTLEKVRAFMAAHQVAA